MCLHMSLCVYTLVYVCVCVVYRRWDTLGDTSTVSTDPGNVFVLVGAAGNRENVAQGNAGRVQRREGSCSKDTAVNTGTRVSEEVKCR